ncbi:diguanylate cyclase [Laedolimicola ammoniilytica]|uniref:Stage 0 sporulation protein A homolog n=1 Tax=Laedolimicola ammoniilytica TaxID=2981771 RepID=A0ABT2RXP7_9FIRM|nr:diguanylate cyclase [Laedolimicola ammoniilytica]MCU6696942.1 diguanylate cyclase [Laedolimicola ammoniilytica]SCI00016.1 Cyclic di-GMP phosphodiesterase response regulator RpfG [uncultured Clostridium sp.]
MCAQNRMTGEQAEKRMELLKEMFARYAEIDGGPYIMEMMKQLNEDTLLDSDDCEKLMGRLTIYNEKLYRDALTGAYNRRFYEDEVRGMKERAGVAVIDLDDFKLYNDTYGHHAGDMVLETVADIIRNFIRKSDMLIRYGGDEFLLILPGIRPDAFSSKLQLIQERIHAASVPGYHHLQISVSIGGVMFDGGDISEALSRADTLMYQAKVQKNMVVTEWDARKADEGVIRDTRQQILIVDDSEMNRAILAEILRKDYRILEAENGEECIRILEQYGTDISLVLLDLVMLKMDGFEVLSVMNRRQWIEDIPVIMISSEDSSQFIQKAYEYGASDYIARPFDARVVYQRVFNTIKLYAKQRRLLNLVTAQVYEKERSNRIMLAILSQIVEFRNGESGLHVIHINVVTELLLEHLMSRSDRYYMSWAEQQLVVTASALHDIGKIGIDEKILNKPGSLTKEEFEIMKTHTLIGASMLERMKVYQDEAMVQIAHDICRWHHERYDGKGYPDGLRGDEIPISAQVVALADVYDALTSERVYKKAYTHEEAIQMILNGECGAFNPVLLQCLEEVQDRIKREIEAGSEEDFMERMESEETELTSTQVRKLTAQIQT